MRGLWIVVALQCVLWASANALAQSWPQPPAPIGHYAAESVFSPSDHCPAPSSDWVALASANQPFYEDTHSTAADYTSCFSEDACRGEPNRVLTLFYGYDSWRGVPDGGWSNNGLHTGLNLGTSLGPLSERTGIGFQIGGQLGIYDLAGTDYRFQNQEQPTVQGLVTLGLFRHATQDSPWTGAIVQDWMINHTYSVMGEDSVMYQWRGQLGYAISERTELGLWGACRGGGDSRNVGAFGEVHWRPINQLSFYLHKKWSPGGADTWISFGMPETERLNGPGSLGDYVVGAWVVAPLDDRFSIYSSVNYMHQSAGNGDPGAKEEAWNFFMGVSFTVGRLAGSHSVRGHRWAPLLPVANNGTFLVDASQNF